MIMGNVVEEETSNPAEEWSIDSCQSTTKERPLLAAIMWDGWVGVVEVCEHDNPFTVNRSEYLMNRDIH
jgi:hypothetical protein